MSPFVTFEGPEGSGKSTQVELLRRALAERGVPALFTREPGGTPIGEAVRNVLHDVRNTAMAPETEILPCSAASWWCVTATPSPPLPIKGTGAGWTSLHCEISRRSLRAAWNPT